MNAYQRWEETQGINPVSPEAEHAENAWNAALQAVKADMVARGLDCSAKILDAYITDQ